MKKKNKLKNIFLIPFKGIRMIEASAGTGKTFTIILLYIRLLLGINNKNKKYSIKEILIITYTNNAKLEIQKRLSKNIYKLYIDCLYKKTYNKNFKKIFKKIKNFKNSINILKKSISKINNAPIYTIHGFCKKILKDYNLNYKYNLTEKIYNENKIYEKSTYDFWRKFIFPLNKEISNLVYKYWKHPKNLLSEINPWLNIKSKIFIYKKKNIIFLKNIIKILKKLRNLKKNGLKLNIL
ncbi:UvrD-helicase domain-containing protein [Buchnera aphidicola]|uniref:UvrD-helicase domain-containing protein n=1 Tax=Buchnera aphidicola TaxID=9 RepID=UPI003463AE2C